VSRRSIAVARREGHHCPGGGERGRGGVVVL